jgi:hypothetical protein
MKKKISRRRVLQSGAALGALSTSVGVVSASRGDTVELPVDVHYDGTHTVDKKWWEATKQADRVHRDRDFMRYDGVHGQWVRPGGSERGGHPRIEVEIDPKNTNPKQKVPDEADGVPIDKVERPPTTTQFDSPCGYQDYDYGNDIPGGAQIGFINADGANVVSTASPLMLNAQTGAPFIGTTAHSTDTCERTGDTQEMFHPDGLSSNEVGIAKSTTVVNKLDFVGLDVRYDENDDGDLEYTSDPKAKIVKEDYYEPQDSDKWYNVEGTYTKSAVASVMDSGGGVRKVGQRTCTTYGDLTAYGRTESVTYGCTIELEGQIRWGGIGDAAEGDSGAPVFDNYSTTGWKILGLVSSGKDESKFDFDNGYIFGPAGYEIYERSGERFYFSDGT